MTHLLHASPATWAFPLSLTVTLVFMAAVYLRGWRSLGSTSSSGIQNWRGSSFLFGLVLIWIAVGSPIASCDEQLLTVHMVQHLLLMTFGAPLILLGAPFRPVLLGLPGPVVHALIRPRFVRSLHRLERMLARPAVCWLAATAALVGWHVPAALTLAMRSGTWHALELTSFLVTGLLFWWPVVRSSSSASRPSGWSIVLYLFLATLPCDILSGFLVFSERVAYPVYLSAPRQWGLSALEDQQLAGALMWTAVTIVYLGAAAILSIRLLSPQGGARVAFGPIEIRRQGVAR